MSLDAIKARAAALRAQLDTGTEKPASTAQQLAPVIPMPTSGEPAEAPKAPSTAKNQLEQIAQEVQPTDAATKGALATQALVSMFDPFEDQHGGFNAMLNCGDRTETVPLDSEHFADAVRDAAMRCSGRMIGKDAIATVVSALRTQARGQPRRVVNRRIGMDGTDYLLDLGDADGHMARVNASGVTVEKNGAQPFRRGRGYGELSRPADCTDAAQAWDFVLPMLDGVPEPDQLPMVAAVVEFLRSDSPNPILNLIGPEGSGKSAVAWRVAQAIDPFEGNMPSVGQDERDMVAAAQGRHVVTIDNVSKMGPGVEDLMCRMATGGAVTQRALYSNVGTVTADVHCALLLTGIQSQLRQADALDRALTVSVKKPSAYRPENEVRAEYAAKLPEVLGGLLYFLHVSVRDRATVAAQRAWKHRMVAWNQTGEAIAQALGHPPGHFVGLMASKRQRAAEDYIEGDTFARALVKTLHVWAAEAKPAEKLPGYRRWGKVPGWCAVQTKGRVVVVATAQTICAAVGRQNDDWTNRGPTLPGTARATTGALQRVQGVLGRAGIDATLQPINGANNCAWMFIMPRTEEQ